VLRGAVPLVATCPPKADPRLGHLPPAHPRQNHVGDHELDETGMPARVGQRLLGRRRLQHLVPRGFKDLAHEDAHRLLVLDEEDGYTIGGASVVIGATLSPIRGR
jgi:hypothetical protein